MYDQREPTAVVSPGAKKGPRARRAVFVPIAPEAAPSAEELSFAALDLPPAERAASLSLFWELPHEARQELARRITIRRCRAGQPILREGDRGEACYVIHAGQVRVRKREPGPGAELVEVGRLGPGALFGEFALLADRRRHASVEATRPSTLFEIPRRVLRDLAARYPGVGPALERLYRERLMANLVATAPFLRALDEGRRAAVLTRFATRKVGPGEDIVREGEAAGGLYLVVLGTVHITRSIDESEWSEGSPTSHGSAGRGRSSTIDESEWSEGSPTSHGSAGRGRSSTIDRTGRLLLASLGEGAYFGEMSLLSGEVASATVTAAGPVEVAMLPPKLFYELVAAHPALWRELAEEARRRELTNRRIVAGQTTAA